MLLEVYGDPWITPLQMYHKLIVQLPWGQSWSLCQLSIHYVGDKQRGGQYHCVSSTMNEP